MVCKKYQVTLLNLLDEWFSNKKQLADYDFIMLQNLATLTINGQYGNKKANTDEVKDNKNQKV